MPKVTRQFARSDRTLGVDPYVNVSGTGNAPIGKAIAEGAEQVGGAVQKMIETSIRRDAAAISANTFTSVQQQTMEDFSRSQTRIKSSMELNDPEARYDNLEVLVDEPDGEKSPYNHAPFTKNIIGKYDDRVKTTLDSISNPLAKRELSEQFASMRSSVLTKSLNFEAQAKLLLRKEAIANAYDVSSRVIFENPEAYTEQKEIVSNLAKNSGIGVDDQAALLHELNNSLAVAAAEGVIQQDPFNADKRIRSSDFKEGLTGDQLSSLTNIAQNNVKVVLAQKRKTLEPLLYDDLLSLEDTGQGLPGIEDEINTPGLYTEAQKVNLMAAREAALKAYPGKGKLETGTIAETPGLLQILKDKLTGTESNSIIEQAKNRLDRVATHIMSLSKTDPAKLMEELYPEKFDNIDKNNLREVYLTRKALEDSKGINKIDSRGVTNSERDAFIDTLHNTKSESILAVLQDYQKRLDGEGQEHLLSYDWFGEILEKHDGLAPMYRMLVENVNMPIAMELVSAMTAVQKKELEFDDEKDQTLKLRIGADLNDWVNGAILGKDQNEEEVRAVKDASLILSKYYMAKLGFGMKDAVRRATNALTGSTKVLKKEDEKLEGMEAFNPITGKRAKIINGEWHVIKDGKWVLM